MNPREAHAQLVAEQRAALQAATTEEQRQAVLADYGPRISMANSRVQFAEQPDPEWHTSPDGSLCCCTAEDRRYGCGCR